MWNSLTPPPPLPTPLESSIKWASQQRACRYNQGSGHITFSSFRVEMLLKKGFQLRTASTQQQALILLNSNNQETHLGLRKQKKKSTWANSIWKCMIVKRPIETRGWQNLKMFATQTFYTLSSVCRRKWQRTARAWLRFTNLWLLAWKESFFQNNLPCSHCAPVKPEGHKHRYFFSVNPDWQVPLFWQRGVSQALFERTKIRFEL